MYRERLSRVAGAVVWQRTVPAGDGVQRVLPDGCMDLIWADGALLVAGPDTAAHVARGDPGTRYTGLRFSPGTGPAVMGVPAHELRDRRVPLVQLWPAAEARRVTEHVQAAAGPGVVLEEIAIARLRRTDPPHPAIPTIVARLCADATVAATAEAVGLGYRQLHRCCLAAFGYGPKMLARILRMNWAVAMARSGTPFAAVAVAAGYADQSHLARDVKALAGVPLSVLTA